MRANHEVTHYNLFHLRQSIQFIDDEPRQQGGAHALCESMQMVYESGSKNHISANAMNNPVVSQMENGLRRKRLSDTRKWTHNALC
jgi:hypothetical protein